MRDEDSFERRAELGNHSWTSSGDRFDFLTAALEALALWHTRGVWRAFLRRFRRVVNEKVH